MGLLTFGGGGVVVQNRESPDFRSPEVGISAHPIVPPHAMLYLGCSGLGAAFNTATLMGGGGGRVEGGGGLLVSVLPKIDNPQQYYWMKTLS